VAKPTSRRTSRRCNRSPATAGRSARWHGRAASATGGRRSSHQKQEPDVAEGGCDHAQSCNIAAYSHPFGALFVRAAADDRRRKGSIAGSGRQSTTHRRPGRRIWLQVAKVNVTRRPAIFPQRQVETFPDLQQRFRKLIDQCVVVIGRGRDAQRSVPWRPSIVDGLDIDIVLFQQMSQACLQASGLRRAAVRYGCRSTSRAGRRH